MFFLCSTLFIFIIYPVCVCVCVYSPNGFKFFHFILFLSIFDIFSFPTFNWIYFIIASFFVNIKFSLFLKKFFELVLFFYQKSWGRQLFKVFYLNHWYSTLRFLPIYWHLIYTFLLLISHSFFIYYCYYFTYEFNFFYFI